MVNTEIRLIIFFAAKMEMLYTVKQKQDGELTVAQIIKFRLKLKKLGKTTRPFRYDLNQIAYDYPVEVPNRFKRLDLIECVMNYDIVQETGSKIIPKKKNAKKQNGCPRRPYK